MGNDRRYEINEQIFTDLDRLSSLGLLRLLSLSQSFICVSLVIAGLQISPHQAQAESAHERAVIHAEELIAKGSLAEAISQYESTLNVLLSQELDSEGRGEVGKVHSRLGQLYLKRMLKAPSGDYALDYQARAALHYLKCVQINELSSIIRERVCAPKVEQLLTPLRVVGKPYRLDILHPVAFRGATSNGQLLPRGLVSISYQKTVTTPAEQRLIRLPQETPLDFTERSYMPPRPLLNSTKGLVFKPIPSSPEYKLYQRAIAQQSNSAQKTPIVPGILMAGVGIAGLITGGVIDGLSIDVPMGNEGVKALYIAGGVFTALGGAWLSWTW